MPLANRGGTTPASHFIRRQENKAGRRQTISTVLRFFFEPFATDPADDIVGLSMLALRLRPFAEGGGPSSIGIGASFDPSRAAPDELGGAPVVVGGSANGSLLAVAVEFGACAFVAALSVLEPARGMMVGIIFFDFGFF